MVEIYLIATGFAVIGGGLKYIDEAFDEENFSQKIASILAMLLLIIWIGLSYLDPASGTILLAVLIGVLSTGKIDNGLFQTSTAAIFGALIFLGKFLFAPLLFLTLTGIFDEKGNDYVDTHKTSEPLRFFFLHRFTMKLGLLLLCLTGFLAYLYLAAFLLFDISYDTVGFISSKDRAIRINIKKEHAAVMTVLEG